jgi:hypothetical protein
MFRPCKRAIIRLFLEPVTRHTQWEYGGGKEISSYIIHVGLKYMLQWGFPIIHYKDVINTFLYVVPGVLVGLVVYCDRGSLWLGRRWVRCHTRASGFLCRCPACLSGYHCGSGLSCEVRGSLWNVHGSVGLWKCSVSRREYTAWLVVGPITYQLMGRWSVRVGTLLCLTSSSAMPYAYH